MLKELYIIRSVTSLNMLIDVIGINIDPLFKLCTHLTDIKQWIAGISAVNTYFKEILNAAEDALGKVKDLLELINDNKWEDCEQNQDEYNFNTKPPIGAEMMFKSIDNRSTFFYNHEEK